MCHLLLLVTIQNPKETRKVQLFQVFWQKPPKAKENLEKFRETHWKDGNCRSRPKQRKTLKIAEKISMCHLFVCSVMLQFRRKPWQWTKETGIIKVMLCCSGKSMEIATFSAVVPDGASQSKGKIRKRQRNPLKGWKLQLFQQFGRSRPTQRKTLKIAEKISHMPSVCM